MGAAKHLQIPQTLTNVQLPNFPPLVLLSLLNDSVMSLVPVAPKMHLRIDDAKNTGLKKPSA